MQSEEEETGPTAAAAASPCSTKQEAGEERLRTTVSSLTGGWKEGRREDGREERQSDRGSVSKCEAAAD